MAREYARIVTAIWGDKDFKALDAKAQRLYVLILSQPDLTMCGIITPALARWSSTCSDGSLRTTKAAIKDLTDKRFLIMDDDTDELWVRSFVHHDLNLKIPNVWVGMSKGFDSISSDSIRCQFLKELRKGFPKGFPDVLDEGSVDRLSKGFMKAFLMGSEK